MYSVGPSQNYAKQLPVLFWAAVTSIFRMRLTSYKLQYGRAKSIKNRLKKFEKNSQRLLYHTSPLS